MMSSDIYHQTGRKHKNTALNAVLPVTAAAAEAANIFKSTATLPKGANRGLCAKAVDKVIRQKLPIDEAFKTLVGSERVYVSLVLAEYQEWLIEQGHVKPAAEQPETVKTTLDFEEG